MWVIDDQQYLGKLDGWNRAAQFADGLFETMVVKDKQIQNLALHVVRMSLGLSRLNITPPDENLADLFESYAHIFSDHTTLSDGVLKIIVSRGDSQRGYAYDEKIEPHITAFFNELPKYDDNIYTHGIKVELLSTQCSIQPQLAGLKHLGRLENVLAKKELGLNGFEGLMANHLGFVIEGTMSNVFFEREGRLITPNLAISGVEGIMRQCVLKYAVRNNISTLIEDISMKEMDTVEHGFICNSVLGLAPIKELKGRPLALSQMSVSLVKAWKSGEIYE